MPAGYHILNGDALKEQFPNEIDGEIIVARECLVDGNVSAGSLEELFEIRAKFISEFYGDYSKADYYKDSVTEFRKIQSIPEGSEINLWFEDDLFCQVNFWFTVDLILGSTKNCQVYLIRPMEHTPYGFGGLTQVELVSAYSEKEEIIDLKGIAELWVAYQSNDINGLERSAKELDEDYPFILEAVKAHIDRMPNGDHPGRPVQALKEIMAELGTDSFGPVFMEFNKRESIYGFGDLQVKRLFDQIKESE